MNELIVALALLLFGRDDSPFTLRPTPLTVQPGAVETIPEPLPYVLYETHWG